MQDNNVETNIRDPYTGNPLTNIVDASASQLPELTREEGEYRKVASVADGLANIYKQVVDSASNGMGITPEEASDVNVAVTTMADSIGLECRMPSMESFHEGVMGRTIGTTLTIESIGETISKTIKRLIDIFMRMLEKFKAWVTDKSRHSKNAVSKAYKAAREKIFDDEGEFNIPYAEKYAMLLGKNGQLLSTSPLDMAKTLDMISRKHIDNINAAIKVIDAITFTNETLDSKKFIEEIISKFGTPDKDGNIALLPNAFLNVANISDTAVRISSSVGEIGPSKDTLTVRVSKGSNLPLMDQIAKTNDYWWDEVAKLHVKLGKVAQDVRLSKTGEDATLVLGALRNIREFISAYSVIYTNVDNALIAIFPAIETIKMSKEEMDEPEDDNYLGDAGDADLTNDSEVLSPDDTLALEQLHEAADKLVDLQYRFEDRYSEGNKFSMEEHFDIQSEVRAIRVSLGMSTEDLTFENLYTEEDVKESQWKTISKTLLDIFKRIIAMAKRLFNKAADWFDQAMHSKVGKNIRHIVSILGKIGRAGIAGGLSIKFKPAYAGLVIDDRITSNIGDDLNALFMANLDVLDAANSDITGTSDMVTEIGKIIQEGHDKYNTTAGSTGTGVSIPVAGGGEYTASPEAIGIAKRISGKFKNKHKTVIPLSKSRKQKTTVYTYSKPLIGNSILLSITDDTNPLANIANRGIVLAEIEKLEEMFEFDTGFNIKGTDSVLARFDKQVTVDILNYGNINSAMERVQTLALTREEMMDKISKHMSELNALFTKIERGLEKINIDASYGEAVALVLRITTDTVRRQTNLTRASESALVKPVDSFTVFVADANAELARRTNQ